MCETEKFDEATDGIECVTGNFPQVAEDIEPYLETIRAHVATLTKERDELKSELSVLKAAQAKAD